MALVAYQYKAGKDLLEHVEEMAFTNKFVSTP